MSRDASVTLTWGDDDHTFRLALGQLRELQEKTDAGPLELLRRLEAGTWRVDDIRETIRLGLIGAQMEPVKALGLVRQYVDARPLLENVLFAQAILWAGIAGAPDEDTTTPQKKSEVETRSRPLSGASSASEPSMASAVQ